MFATIIVLLALILITPSLLGHPSELASIPALIVAMTEDHTALIVDASGAVQPYLYRNVTLNVSVEGANRTNASGGVYERNDTYSGQVFVPVNETPLWIHAKLVDQQDNYFEYNVTVFSFNDTRNQDKLTLAFNFPDDPGTATRYVVPPADFRWPVPRRGMMPG